MLSIDFWNILFTVINLLIFFLIIKFFLLKPIKKVMDKRQQMIQDDFDSASKAKNEAEELKAEYEGNIQSAKDKAAEITETAKRNAESHRATVIENANADVGTDRNGFFISKIAELTDAIIEVIKPKIIEK